MSKYAIFTIFDVNNPNFIDLLEYLEVNRIPTHLGDDMENGEVSWKYIEPGNLIGPSFIRVYVKDVNKLPKQLLALLR